jgi:hypothetical protein
LSQAGKQAGKTWLTEIVEDVRRVYYAGIKKGR